MNVHSVILLSGLKVQSDIDWTLIETQLLRWENLFRQGKKLRLMTSINYIEATPQPHRGLIKEEIHQQLMECFVTSTVK
jgi:hypothetical protein